MKNTEKNINDIWDILTLFNIPWDFSSTGKDDRMEKKQYFNRNWLKFSKLIKDINYDKGKEMHPKAQHSKLITKPKEKNLNEKQRHVIFY